MPVASDLHTRSVSTPVAPPALVRAGAERQQWIDSAKGLGILLIFFGHVYSTVTPSALYVYIYAFHVPLFFFISGLTLRPAAGPLGGVVQKKLRTLIVPYFWYAFLGYVFYVAGYLLAQHQGLQVPQFDYGLWQPLTGIFIGTIGMGRIINGPVWFVMALFWTFMLGYLVNTYIRRPAGQWVAILLLTGLGLALAGHVTLPFSGVAALTALIFFQAGYRFQTERLLQAMSQSTRWWLLAALFVIGLFSQVNGFIGFGEGILGNPLWFMLFAFSGTLMVVLLVNVADPWCGWLAFIGRYSLSIMLIHMLIIKSVKVVMSGILGVSIQLIDNDVGLGLIVLGVSALCLVPAVFVMERYLPFTLGKSTPARAQALPRP
ncbi:acyltransferase family protein [Hydrogenophaga sp.]|uniref:acyltransferase family protein n=1 Tax=Hydrogenophaga sp. TaxID=1904254 RepID=UPI002728FDF5|nr:acyltransferase family protein [Hydrogenophaga sp.]MDO8903931.1 acyltransferase family protein [Hydrogenophaga sp.]